MCPVAAWPVAGTPHTPHSAQCGNFTSRWPREKLVLNPFFIVKIEMFFFYLSPLQPHNTILCGYPRRSSSAGPWAKPSRYHHELSSPLHHSENSGVALPPLPDSKQPLSKSFHPRTCLPALQHRFKFPPHPQSRFTTTHSPNPPSRVTLSTRDDQPQSIPSTCI